MNAAVTAIARQQIFPNDISGPSGLLKDLLNQPGNGSANIKIRVASTHVPATYGNWASGSNYGVGEIRAYPSGSPLLWKTVNAISGPPDNTVPPYTVDGDVITFNPNWQIDIALDMIQDSGDGVHFYRTTLQKSYDDFVRLNNFQYGTYATTAYQSSTSNYIAATLSATSASSIASNGGVPASKSFTTQAALPELYSSVTLNAAYSNNFAIPTTHPTFQSHNIGVGLNVSEGDTLTFYGDSTHFFIFVVYSYNSITGIAIGFSTFNLSTGTYAIWTIKKEVLLYLKWQSGAVDFYCLVQTYDSGTGATTANNIFNPNGAGALSGWNVFLGKRPQPSTVGVGQSSSYNLGAQNIAVWHFGEFIGTGINHRSIKSTAGTGWTYVYISGPDNPANVTIDMYNGSTITNQSTNVWQNLVWGKHRYVAISCASPSTGLSTNTSAWVYASTNTANVQSTSNIVNYDLFTAEIQCGIQDPQSAGEVAWRFKLNGSAHTTQWWPYHGVVTDRGDAKQFLIDNVLINYNTINGVTNPYLYKYQNFTTAKVVQSGAIIHPQDPGDFATYSSMHILNKQGVQWDVSVTWLKAAFIETGYNNMVSLGEAFFNKAKSEGGTYMNRPSDNTSVNMASNFKNLSSYLFYSTSGSSPVKNLVLGQLWPDITNWRAGLPNSGTSFMQDFTGAGGAKFYPFVYSSYVTTPGENVRIRGWHYLGSWIDANSNL